MKLEYCDSTGCPCYCLCVHNTLIKSSGVTAFQAINIFCSCRNTMQLCVSVISPSHRRQIHKLTGREGAGADGGEGKKVALPHSTICSARARYNKTDVRAQHLVDGEEKQSPGTTSLLCIMPPGNRKQVLSNFAGSESEVLIG